MHSQDQNKHQQREQIRDQGRSREINRGKERNQKREQDQSQTCGQAQKRGQHQARMCGQAQPQAPTQDQPGISIHRFVEAEELTPGDLGVAELAEIWMQLVDEKLVDVFFHDGVVRTYYDFLRYARLSGCWFYAARAGGQYLGLGVINDFSSSGNTAYCHFVTFRAGRKLFSQAARLWFPALAGQGGLRNLIAVLPGCYRAARAWAENLGFVEKMRLPGALRLVRGARVRNADAVVLIKTL